MRLFWRLVTEVFRGWQQLSTPSRFLLSVLVALVGGAAGAMFVLVYPHAALFPFAVENRSLYGTVTVAAAIFLVAAAVDTLERREMRRTEQLVAGLEAQAQLETARAIREVNRELEESPARAPSQEPVPPAPAPLASGPGAYLNRPPPGCTIKVAQENEGFVAAVGHFYTQALILAYGWFVASVLAALVGLGVIVREVILVGNQSPLDAGVKVAAAALAGAIGSLFYRQANATRKHAADLLTSTQGDRRAETAKQILDTIRDDERREEIAGQLAMHLAGAPASQARRSAGKDGSESHSASATSARRGSTRRSAAPAEQDGAE
jgi:hypothetical protein